MEKMTVGDLCRIIEESVPLRLQESWDNSGLMIGFEDDEVERIMTCLEIDMDVIREAESLGCNVIVTHHPLIFSGVMNICSSTYEGQMIMELMSRRISVYSTHTPFDKVKGGNNDAVAGFLGLCDVKNLKDEDIPEADEMAERNDTADIGRTGYFEKPITLGEAAGRVCMALGLNRSTIRAVGRPEWKVEKVGLCTGAGSDLFDDAIAAGCDLFITGDVKYHEARYAIQRGLSVIDAGHYGTERIFGEIMKERLDALLDGGTEVIASFTDIDPFMKM